MPFVIQANQPLYQDILWMEPQKNDQDSQVLILGGNSQSLQTVQIAFDYCNQLNLKTSIILPDVLRKILANHKQDSNILFMPTTPSGSYSKKGLATILDLANQHQSLLIAGDLSSNSETQQLIKELMLKFKGLKVLSGEIIPFLLKTNLDEIQNTTLILSNDQVNVFLKKYSLKADLSINLFGEELTNLKLKFNVIFPAKQYLWVQIEQQVCATKIKPEFEFDSKASLKLVSQAIFYNLNNPNKPYPCLVSAVWKTIN